MEEQNEINKPGGYDMHCHTKASDGALPLSELVGEAKKANLEGFVVTDHDELLASKEAKYITDQSKLDVISGIELSAKIKNYLIDITGYFVNPYNKDLEDVCKINQDFRRASIGKTIQKINEVCGINPPMTYDEVCGKEGSVTKNHINAALIKRGIYKEREAFDTILDSNSPDYCCVERDAIEAYKAIETIIKSGGIVGLPHPAFVPFDYPELSDKDFLELMSEYFGDIKVIETEYPYNVVRPKCKVTIENENFWRAVATNYGLIGVGGSDGHQNPKLSSIGERRTDKTIVDKIKELSKK